MASSLPIGSYTFTPDSFVAKFGQDVYDYYSLSDVMRTIQENTPIGSDLTNIHCHLVQLADDRCTLSVESTLFFGIGYSGYTFVPVNQDLFNRVFQSGLTDKLAPLIDAINKAANSAGKLQDEIDATVWSGAQADYDKLSAADKAKYKLYAIV